jgi:nucleoid DNA-binding protein
MPADVEKHLLTLVTESISFDMIKELWIKKDKLFSDQIALLAMDEVNHLDENEERGILLLTYSGSLISLGCGKKRSMEYASIKLRGDVPDIIKAEKVSLGSSLDKGAIATFIGGQVQNTSSLYKIVVCREGVSIEEQEKRIREATIFITNSFIHLNRHLTIADGGNAIDQFNKKEMIRYIAGKNGVSQKVAKEIIDDFTLMAETGLLLGKTVSLGSLGKLSMKWKAEKKARLGRNPATGEEITIGAKEAHYAPAFKFSSKIKEKCEIIEKQD